MQSKYEQEIVLQLPGRSKRDYDNLIELEDRIIKDIGDWGYVDGHDMGMGEMNIFVRTAEPRLAFEVIRRCVEASDLIENLKAAYRKVGTDEFTVLYPKGLEKFAIQ